MAQPIRRRIVEVLSSGEHAAGNLEAVIVAEFGVGRSAVQHHLAYLKRCNWVVVREEWTSSHYRLETDVIPSLESEVRRLRRRWNRRIGWLDGADPKVPRAVQRSRKGRRGRGRDPDDPWWRFD